MLNRLIFFSRRFYIRLGLLHAGVLLRVLGDFISWWPGRRWGGAISAIAIALFLLNTIVSLIWNRTKEDVLPVPA